MNSQSSILLTRCSQPGVYVGTGASWANSYYAVSFSTNTASMGGSSIFCNAGYIYSLLYLPCNGSNIECVSCQLGVIENSVYMYTSSLTFTSISTQYVTLYLASPLPVTLSVPYSLTWSIPVYADSVIITPSGSIDFPAGSTQVTVSVAINPGLAQSSVPLNLQGTLQLLPPTPELLVLLEGNTAFSMNINIAPASSDSVRIMSSWLVLFRQLLDVVSW